MFDLARELGEGDDGHLHFFGEQFQAARDFADERGAVVVAAVRQLHELQVVDEDEAERADFAFQAAHPRAQFGDGEVRAVVDVERRVLQLADGERQFAARVVALDVAFAQL